MIVEGQKLSGSFISRPNRFLALVRIDGKATPCYLADPGRLMELLVPGVEVIVRCVQNESIVNGSASCKRKREKSTKDSRNVAGNRRTQYDLFAVVLHEKDNVEKLVSVDTRLPNRLVREALLKREPGEFRKYGKVVPEYRYGSSRLDFMLEGLHGEKNEKCLLEVKGCSLVIDGIALFPDAPTERGRRHLEELIKAKNDGTCNRACILFVVQREDAYSVEPNRSTDPKFADTLHLALSKGVEAYAYTAKVTKDHVILSRAVPVKA